MKEYPHMNHRRFIKSFIIAVLFSSIVASGSLASTQQSADKKPIIFKAPSGYMPAELSGHTGKLFLDQQRPAGMFVGYPKDGQDTAAFTDEVKNIVAGMFLHDAKSLVWSSATLPPHKGIESESGNLMTTSDDKMEVQLAFYSRPEGVAYGYFAMRHKKPKGDDGKFLDSSGAGLKALDELAKSISSKAKQ
ncbi:MAG TPA: hypothetical protein VF397_08465 [Pyrinomonadaceae bacterium]